jgi:cytochrome c oxidase subunit IV
MRQAIRRLVLVWVLLITLGAVELAASYLSLPRGWRPLVMLPGAAMVGVVAVGFMDVRRGPALVRAFAVAGILWLLVLLGLGSADPLTRTPYPVPNAQVK